jgi:hypothetical protein
MMKEAVGCFGDFIPPTIRFGEPFGEKTRSTQLAGPERGPGIYQFFHLSREVRQGVNIPSEESDLGKLPEEEVRKKFGRKDIRIVQYKEGASGNLQASRKEIWPFFLAFLLMVLGGEMVVANGVPRGKE